MKLTPAALGTKTRREGTWHHEKRGSRYGWWWSTGGYGYFYAVPLEAPDHVSQIAEPDSAIEAESDEPAAVSEVAPAALPRVRAYYYSGGVLKHTYDRLTECDDALKSDSGCLRLEIGRMVRLGEAG